MTCAEVMRAVDAAVERDDVHLGPDVLNHVEACEACRMSIEEHLAAELAKTKNAKRALDEAMPEIHRAIDHIAHGVVEGTAVVEDRDKAVKNAKAWLQRRRDKKNEP